MHGTCEDKCCATLLGNKVTTGEGIQLNISTLILTQNNCAEGFDCFANCKV